MIHWLFAQALAFDVPSFAPDQHVVRIPAELPFRTVQTDPAVTATRHPTYVVIAERVMDGRITAGNESETEEAIEAVWREWSLDPRFDPTVTNLALLSLDEREVRLRAGTTWDAEYGFGPDRVGRVIDRHFLPQARVGELDGGLAAMVVGLDDDIDSAVRGRVTQRIVLRGGAVGLLVAAGVMLAGSVLSRIRRAREAFEGAAAARRAVLDRAEVRLADLGLSIELRDRIVALRVKGDRTQALVAEVGERLDRLRVGLVALRKRLNDIQQIVARTAGGWTEKTALLDAPFEVDTGEVATALFAPETRRVTIAPATALAELEAEWDAARAGWARVLDAVDASLRTAEADLTAEDLERLVDDLEGAGLPLTWVEGHPLRPDPAATWAALDTLRIADPVAYLDALEEAIAEDDALELRVARLVGGRSEVQRARAEAEALDTGELDTVPVDASEDPAAVSVELSQAVDTMEAALRGTDVTAAERAIDRALEIAHRLAALETAVRDAVATAADQLQALEPNVQRLEGDVKEAAEQVRQVLQRHTAPSVHTALQELASSTSGKDAALGAVERARTALAEHHHLRAATWVREAERHATAALQDLLELLDAVGAAERARERAELLWEELGTIRHRHDRAISSFGSYGLGLAEGDACLARLREEWEGAGDWSARLAGVQRVVEAWQVAETQARAAWDEEQRRRAAQARALAAATARRSVSRSSGSSYRSTSSRSSSGGRSAGRSSSSSGRSAGRRF